MHAESPRTVIAVTASVKDERRGQGDTSAKPITSVCHVTPRCEHTLFLHDYFLDFVLSAMDGKIEQHVCIKFHMKLGKFTTETPEMLREALGDNSFSRTVVFE
jgi:hypothetical protein